MIAERGCKLVEENSQDELKELVEEYGTGLVMTMGIKDIENINIIDILLDCLSYIDKQVLIASTRYDLGNDPLQHACYGAVLAQFRLFQRRTTVEKERAGRKCTTHGSKCRHLHSYPREDAFNYSWIRYC